MSMSHHTQLSLHSRIMFVNCKVNLNIAAVLLIPDRMTAEISYELSHRQQIKVQLLTLLSSKGFNYLKDLPKNVATTTTLIIL